MSFKFKLNSRPFGHVIIILVYRYKIRADAKLKLDPSANFEDTRYNNVYVDIKCIFSLLHLWEAFECRDLVLEVSFNMRP